MRKILRCRLKAVISTVDMIGTSNLSSESTRELLDEVLTAMSVTFRDVTQSLLSGECA